MSNGIKKAINEAEQISPTEPMPLKRKSSEPAEYPIKALGKLLGDAAIGIADRIQCPIAIAANSVLASASLATQAQADVVHPASLQPLPISLFLVTIAASGERKSTADKIALKPIVLWENELRREHTSDVIRFQNAKDIYEKQRNQILNDKKKTTEQKQAELRALGAPPASPVTPMLTAPDPTIEGLHKFMAEGPLSFGVFSDEGGAFIGGYGMSDEARLRTGAGFSKLWDGAPVKRIRGGDETLLLSGRRVSLHLMAQPGVVGALVTDPLLRQQGLTSRMLVSSPSSKVGFRFARKEKRSTNGAIDRYTARLYKLVRMPHPIKSPNERELAPRELVLRKEALEKWTQFHDETEREMGPTRKYEAIKGFASKLAEHALRIAGVLELVDNSKAIEISASSISRAIQIADYFGAEAIRAFEESLPSAEIANAERLLEWLRSKWNKPMIALQHVYQLGPNSIREARLAREAMLILEQHGWVQRHIGRAEIGGKRFSEAWNLHAIQTEKC